MKWTLGKNISFNYRLAALGLLGIVSLFSYQLQALAVVQAPKPAAKISFTFDDGYTSALTQAAPVLAKYGLTGTEYVVTGCVGMVTVPNTCRADSGKTYMTWDQVVSLKNQYGWEIGSHTVTHPYLASTDSRDGQPNKLTPTQVDTELSQSKTDLAAHGIDAKAFASPYGDYDMPVLAQIAKYYSSHRGFADTGYNSHPYSDYIIRDQPVQGRVAVSTVKSYIDQAVASKTWLVLTFHDIKTKAAQNKDYEYSTSNLDQIAAYAKSKVTAGLLSSVNVSQGIVTSDTNLLPISSFNNGIADGWTTDSPAYIAKNTESRGSYPDATNSIKLASGGTAGHLYSPFVTVDPNTTYILKSFLNVTQRSSGEISFYIDEYDAAGNWVSGQFKAAEASVFMEELNFNYRPSSNNVSKARLQISVPANSGVVAYFDNAQWFGVDTAPAKPNMMVNGTFDGGISGGWRTNNPAYVVLDSNNNGSPANPVSSVKMTSTTSNIYLFSPNILSEYGKSYALTAYINLKQLGAGKEVGFYVDEYDASGKWISGQYKGGVRSVSSGNFSFNYSPTSSAVRYASWQFGVSANSSTLVYIDNVVWTLN